MFAVFYWFNLLCLLPTAVSQPGSEPIFNTFACQRACLIHAWKTLKMVFDINANNSVSRCCPGSTPDSQQEHTNTHTRHAKPEEMPNAKVCHVSVPDRTRCSPFNACWLLHKHCALTFIWAFYIKVVELNMKSGTRLCCLSWQSALRQTHAYAQIWIQSRSINELQLQLGGTTIYKKMKQVEQPTHMHTALMQNNFWRHKSPDPHCESCELTWNTK